jgi:hypothetical protein
MMVMATLADDAEFLFGLKIGFIFGVFVGILVVALILYDGEDLDKKD